MLLLLNFERSDKCIGFMMMCMYVCTISNIKNSSIFNFKVGFESQN